jgi:TatD DNase family protein
MDWVDSHCHLTDLRVFSRVDQMISDCRAKGISRFILGGVSPEEWQRQIELKKRYPSTFGLCFGLHPWWVDEVSAESQDSCDADDRLEEALTQLKRDLPNLNGLGETGLDWSKNRKRSTESQLWVFREQLELAKKFKKPLVLHIVRTHAEALAELRKQAPFPAGGIVHSFSGNWVQAREYIEMGFLISVSARVTYPQASDLHEVVKNCPAQSLILETDAPDQPPSGSTDAAHTPLSLLQVAAVCAEIRGLTAEQVLGQSRDNVLPVFFPASSPSS